MKSFRKILVPALVALCAMSAWAIDLNESFDGTFFPPVAWQSFETGDGVNPWVRTTLNEHSEQGATRVLNEDVSGGLVSVRWLITPKLHVNNVADSIAFWARTTFNFIVDNDSLYVYLSTTDSLPSSFTTQLAQYKCGSGGAFVDVYVQYILSLGAYVGQDVFVAFVHHDEGDGGNDVYLDDIGGPEMLAPPDHANTPLPADEAVGVSANTNLAWANGDGTTTIDLYLAQTLDSVNNNEPVARKINNVLTTSYDPPVNLQANQTYYWKVVSRNVYGDTQGAVWSFSVIGAPLSGSYDIGGGNNDYPDFHEAIAALEGNGISDAVTFNVYGTDYSGQHVITGPIVGASASDTIKFRDASGTARITCGTYLGATDAALMFDSASYFIFDGIDVLVNHPQDSTYKNMSFIDGSSYNVIRNATITGAGFTGTSVKYGIYLWSNECNYNVFDNLHIKRTKIAVNLSGFTAAGLRPTGNEFKNMQIDSVWTGFAITNEHMTRIHNNDIQLNVSGNASGYWGIDVSTIQAGDTVLFYNNTVRNIFGTTSGGNGMARLDSDQGLALIFNNFAYDFQVTGTGTARGVMINGIGTYEIYNNSIRIGDQAATGQVAAIYIGSSSASVVDRIRNNILYTAEPTAASRGVAGVTSAVPNELDNNVYFNSGGNAYQVYDIGTNDYVTLADLQAATVYEDHGLEGNPGFVSATDLHIDPAQGLVNMNAVPVSYITTDIDGNTRSASPDVGADEYTVSVPANDYAVKEILNPQALYAISTLYPIDVRVQNRGTSAQTNVPVRLFYNGAQQAELLVSLAAQETDTIQFAWTTPATPSSGTLEAQAFLGGDAVPSNDSVYVDVQLVSPPMSGSYDIGGGANHYATIIDAVTDLGLRGISAAVTFNVYALTYSGQVVIPAIVGASATNTITFVQAGALTTPPEITSATSPALQFNGADYVTFDNIDVTLTVAGQCVQMTGDADNNALKNCTVTGTSVATTTNHGVYIINGGNDNNLIENVTTAGTHYGVRLSGTSTTSDLNNEVRNCSITEGRYGVYLERQDGALIHDNDIQPGWAGSTLEISGVHVATHNTGSTTNIYNNEIHNLRTTGVSNGIYVSNGANTTANVYNNFVYGYVVTGTAALYGLRSPAVGLANYYHNSVRIGEVGTTGNIYAFYMTGTTTNAVLNNNILQVDESTEECWSLYYVSGVLTSNYNVVYGTGALYNVGFSTSNRHFLTDWSGATGQDLNSAEGDPGFIDATNLHISPTFSLCDGIGTTIGLVTTDIDGDTRGTPPDIGADEYEFTSLAHDYGVYSFVALAPTYVGGVPTNIQVDLQNFGTNAETNVPVRLFYNGSQTSEILVSLGAGVRDTVLLPWTPPASNFEIGDLEAQAFLGTDAFHDNDSTTTSVTIVGPPMNGTYDLGGGAMDFTSFAEAISSLNLRGIDGEVIIDCYAGTYNESIILTAITGTNFVDRVTFRAHPSALTDIVILTDGVATRVVYVDGADFITFDGIDITATGATNICMEIDNDADYITVKNCAITSRDSTSTSTRGAKINFDGNDNATFDNITVRGAFYGIRMEGTGTQSDNLEVMNCDISGASYGVYLDDCHNSRIHDNDIQPHGYSSTSAYGVYVASLTAGDTAYVYNNRIHNLRHLGTSTSAIVAGINGSSSQVLIAFNNFVWDWSVNGQDIAGLYSSTGTNYWFNNSVRLNNVAAADVCAGLYNSTGTATATNNIFMVEEQELACYGIWRAGGTLAASDYNDIYGTGVSFATGRDGTTPYPTLGDWQTLSRDLNSVAGDPGYVSASDLHIQPSFTLLDGAGIAIPGITFDIDGDVRNDPPDIGADEYDASVTPEDPTALTIIRDAANNNVILNWQPSTGATSYKVYASSDPMDPLFTDPGNLVGTTGATTFTHVNALTLPGNKRFYLVVASTDAP